jgi:alkylation response protein AidB-like acyl-CoA dehydrogenase
LDYTLSPEQRGWQSAARQFADEVIRPVSATWDALPTNEIPYLEPILGASRFGLRLLSIPVEMGGRGGDVLSHSLVQEEVAAADMGVAIVLSQVYRWTPVITVAMNDEQRARYLPRMLSDDAFFVAGAMTEPGTGSDNQVADLPPEFGIQSRAVREGDDWVLSGGKHFINGAGVASLYAILLRTDFSVPASRGCTYFLLQPDTPGFSVVRQHDKMAGRLGALAELRLEGCRLPDSERLGAIGDGHAMMTGRFRYMGRLLDGSSCVGLAREALRVGMAWVTDRVQGGSRLIDHQAMAMLMAETAVEVEAARSLAWRAAWMVEQNENEDFDYTGAAKHFAAETAMRATRRTLEAHGGYGIMRDWLPQKLYRDAATTMHFGGTQQIVLLRLARQLDAAMSAGLLH